MFCKNALFDQQTRVNLVVSPARNAKHVDRGRVRTDPVGLHDLFPTIVHLATDINLPHNAIIDESGIALDGKSVLQPKRDTLQVYTFAHYPRCSQISANGGWECVTSGRPCGRKPNTFMGYMVRTASIKYVEWRYFKEHFTHCARPAWEGLDLKLRMQMKPVQQINASETFTLWSTIPKQREMFTDYPNSSDFQWGRWEKENVLVETPNKHSEIVLALELSAAIRWRFDPGFTPFSKTSLPCSGNGWVRLGQPAKWSSLAQQPAFQDIVCSCLAGFQGKYCSVEEEDHPPRETVLPTRGE